MLTKIAFWHPRCVLSFLQDVAGKWWLIAQPPFAFLIQSRCGTQGVHSMGNIPHDDVPSDASIWKSFRMTISTQAFYGSGGGRHMPVMLPLR